MMQSHRCWRVKMHIYTYIHFCIILYVHTCVLGLDLATAQRKKGFVFLINKACHERWPCVTRGGGSSVWQQLFCPLSLCNRRWCCHYDTRLSSAALDRSSEARRHLDTKRFNSTGCPASVMSQLPTVMSYSTLQWLDLLSVFSMGQIFDIRRPLVAPSEARSLGSLALRS